MASSVPIEFENLDPYNRYYHFEIHVTGTTTSSQREPGSNDN